MASVDGIYTADWFREDYSEYSRTKAGPAFEVVVQTRKAPETATLEFGVKRVALRIVLVPCGLI